MEPTDTKGGLMRLRRFFLIALWVALVAGVTHLVDGRTTHTALAVATSLAALLVARVLVAARVRWRRVRSWRRPGEAALYPPGPRRVLLTDTGLAGRR
jgi:hypothetical protein